MVGMDKTQPIRLKLFHENDGGRAKNGTQCKQCGKECTLCIPMYNLRLLDVYNFVKIGVHTRERCELCGEEQYNRHYLRKHKAAVHGILPQNAFKCEYCPDFFIQESKFQKHLETKHK